MFYWTILNRIHEENVIHCFPCCDYIQVKMFYVYHFLPPPRIQSVGERAAG